MEFNIFVIWAQLFGMFLNTFFGWMTPMIYADKAATITKYANNDDTCEGAVQFE